MECYWCKYGWPKPIRDIYRDALAKLDGDDSPLLFGPAHIVWEDENWDSAQWCLDNFDEYRRDLSDEACAVVRDSLERLIAVPEEYKNEPADDAPPPEHWQCAPPDPPAAASAHAQGQ